MGVFSIDVALRAPEIFVAPVTPSPPVKTAAPATFRVPSTTVLPVLEATVNLLELTAKLPPQLKVPKTEVFPEAAVTVNLDVFTEKSPVEASVPKDATAAEERLSAELLASPSWTTVVVPLIPAAVVFNIWPYVLAMVCPVKAAIKVPLSILYKLKIVNFCNLNKPLVVLVLIQSNKAFVTKVFDTS
jgi:hypothetical protein